MFEGLGHACRLTVCMCVCVCVWCHSQAALL